MIPLLIVDDESIIRETIAAMLRRKYPEQFHIFLASNGQEALSLVASESVELVLADIKMPVMDGLQLLHCLHEQQLQCDVIFISGFDDYSFVREAMKSGAVDYLLKPIAEDELYAQIDSFLKRAALRVPIHTARIRPEENVYLQQYVLDKLFDGTDAIPDSVLAELHLPPAAPAALLAAPVISSEADLQWFEQVHQTLQPLLEAGCTLFQGRKRQMCLSLCLFSNREQYDVWSRLLPGSSAQALSPATQLPHVPELLPLCQKLLERRFFDLPGEDGPESYPYSTLISEMTDEICHLQAEAYHQTLLLLLRRACAQYPPVDSLRQLLCAMIYAILQGNASFVAVFSQMELTADDIICTIQQTNSADALYHDMTRIIDLQISRIQGQITPSDETHVKRACDYIQAHFAEDFTLADLAEHLELHPNYVSTIFRKVCGTSFSRYRKRLRMEEACRLIRETNDKFYLIGSKVGYPDAVSFARVFKEEIGCTPSEYRSMHAPGEEG